jgi:hypothetical protein
MRFERNRKLRQLVLKRIDEGHMRQLERGLY